MINQKRFVFIVNPISGNGRKRKIVNLTERMAAEAGVDFSIVNTQRAGHAVELAREAALKGADVVVAIGGDGTVNEVGRGLIGTGAALGIIPCGSGNGLARHLGLSMSTEKAVRVVLEANVIMADYGIVNDHPFFCTCGAGFDAFVSMKFAESGKRGPVNYVRTALREVLDYKPETYELVLDGDRKESHRAFVIACANASQYGNNAYIAPEASLRDGVMDITIVEPFRLTDIPAMSIRLFNKTLDKNSKIKIFKTKKAVIKRSSEGVFHVDGDPVMGPADLDVQIVEGGIGMVVPK